VIVSINHRSMLWAFLCLCWLLGTIFLLEKTGCVIVDGFQSLGSTVAIRYPGDLFWPGLGNFLGYDQYWGFHWHGWPWLYSFITSFFGWNSLVATSIVCVLWLCVALRMRKIARELSPCELPPLLVGWAFWYLLIQPLFLVSGQSLRPEIPTALMLLGLMTTWGKAGTPASQWLQRILLLVLPSMHPLGFVIPATWIAWEFLSCWLHRWQHLPQCLLRGIVLAAGLALFLLWHVQGGGAPWQQFLVNIEQQGQLTKAMGLGHEAIFRMGWGIMPMKLMWPVLLLASCTALAVLIQAARRQFHGDIFVLSAMTWWIALLFMVVTKNPNALHLIGTLPFALLLCLRGLSHLAKRPRINGIPGAAVLLMASFPILLIPGKRMLGLWNTGFTGYRESLADLYARVASEHQGTIYIPVSLWEAAAQHRPPHDYRFSTFPNILVTEMRLDYEKNTFAAARSGDILIIDDHQETAGVFNQFEETAMKQKFLIPWDNPEWALVELIVVKNTGVTGASSTFRVFRKN
jgi:hypothetical protein